MQGRTSGSGLPPVRDLVSRSFVLARLHTRLATNHHERYDINGPQRDYRIGHGHARDDEAAFLRALIAELELGRTVDGLRELRDAVPTVTEAVSVFSGEGG